MTKKRTVNVLLAVLPIAIGILSAVLTKDMMKEYGAMTKPALSPPASVFPIVWTILYLLMGIASVIVYNSEGSENRTVGLYLHFMQLIFNFFWSIIFFNLKMYMFAFVWLVLLFMIVISMIANYRKVNLIAGLLNIPYLTWLIFAGYLNFMVYFIN